jgi:SAM-dependent methyltransferase
MLFQVAGTNDIPWFLASGARGAESLRGILAKHGLDLEKFEAILDFGCGVGRVMRHWNRLQGPRLYGTDYNPELIGWCKQNLLFASFLVNPLVGILEYENEKFDLIYALSVFTHLTEDQQIGWIEELSRVLRPGGYLLITTHGSWYCKDLLPEDQARFRQGELVVHGTEHAGENTCAAFHPESYVRSKLARGMTVVDFIPEGALGNPRQDAYLLRKPATAQTD